MNGFLAISLMDNSLAQYTGLEPLTGVNETKETL